MARGSLGAPYWPRQRLLEDREADLFGRWEPQWYPHSDEIDLCHEIGSGHFLLRGRITPENVAHLREVVSLIEGVLNLKKPAVDTPAPDTSERSEGGKP